MDPAAPLGAGNDPSRQAFDRLRRLSLSSGRAQTGPAHAEEPLSEDEMASRSIYTTEIPRRAASRGGPRPPEREDGRAELRSPTCGSRISLAVQLDGDRRVERLSIRVNACAFGQASAALLARLSRGRTHDEVSDAMGDLATRLA